MNYCEWLFNTKEEFLNNEALINGEDGKRLTYRELKDDVIKVSTFLKEKGFKPGAKISMHLYNSIEVATILLAVQYLGCVICLIDPLFKEDELEYYLKDSDSECIITYFKSDQVDLNIKIEFININEIKEQTKKTLNHGYFLNYYKYKYDELALILYTSGSTSTPKGVMISVGCLYTFLKKSNKSMYNYKPEDRILCFVPFSHGFGSVSILIPSLVGKSAVVFLKLFQPTVIADVIDRENISHIFGVPTHYQQLLRYKSIHKQLRKLKAAFSAAAPLNYQLSIDWYENIGVYLDEGFGLSEATTLIATRLSQLPKISGDVGFPPLGILKVEAVDENKNTCDTDIIGELRVKGEGLMLGYYKRPEETAERIIDDWLYTGDLGYVKENGSIVVCGRITEFINVAGLKISPIEIESVLNNHPDVLDSAVCGIEDEVYGEVVIGFVVLKNEKIIKARELIRYTAQKLANFKVPKQITFLTKIPRNNIGKIDRNILKNLRVM